MAVAMSSPSLRAFEVALITPGAECPSGLALHRPMVMLSQDRVSPCLEEGDVPTALGERAAIPSDSCFEQ